MAQRDFRVGDRVIVNDRNATYSGRTGTVKYVSGGQCWVKFDGDSNIVPGFYPWWLDPLREEAPARA